MPAGVRAALRSIDDWDLNVIFQRRVNVMISVPHCLVRKQRGQDWQGKEGTV